jgi:hypothetical protein
MSSNTNEGAVESGGAESNAQTEWERQVELKGHTL